MIINNLYGSFSWNTLRLNINMIAMILPNLQQGLVMAFNFVSSSSRYWNCLDHWWIIWNRYSSICFCFNIKFHLIYNFNYKVLFYLLTHILLILRSISYLGVRSYYSDQKLIIHHLVFVLQNFITVSFVLILESISVFNWI